MNLLFQQTVSFPLSIADGCPAHHAITLRNWLNSEFNEHWIGRDGPVLWPPRSPDLTILDFYLWGRLKQIIYREPLENDEEQLKTRIQNAVKSLSIEEIRNILVRVRRDPGKENLVGNKNQWFIDIKGKLIGEMLEQKWTWQML
ncbi:hypothetical protein NQ318_010520 [Aromia moschata]|uniref:Uncharacterized protein n=1 Tax=Aromia moschata TaxID=1265417 RepID=A0AAV8YEQ6_9CUCU|nr:hypothetical protein NQ318_010520 [Aromia moschata]